MPYSSNEFIHETIQNMFPQPLLTSDYHPKHRVWWPKHECVVCGSKAIGFNFGAPTCAPCKAFFRRNARRNELLQTPCPFNEIPSSMTDKTTGYCTKVRYCSSCRLRRCFNMGMKVELVRTDEENERYRQLVETNRQRRRELLQQEERMMIPRATIIYNDLFKQSDWNHIFDIVDGYDTFCLKTYIQRRSSILTDQIHVSDNAHVKITYHASMIINTITSFIAFLSSIQTFKSLSKSDRIFLCKYNIRPLILLNLHELSQLCYSEPWQLTLDDMSSEYILGNRLFAEFNEVKNRAARILITDPVVTRLWLLILFFSTPLHCYYDHSSVEQSPPRTTKAIVDIQNSYITLLWNYLLHRHNSLDAIRIFSNLTGIYLRMQRISQAINTEIRTRQELFSLHEAFNRAVMIDNDKK